MTKDEALKMAIKALEMWDKKHIIEMKVGERWIDLSYAINACKEALEQPDCNSHPKAPHGFNRDASHSADRYVCDCEGWDAWQDGYEKGLREGLAIEQSALTDEKGRPMTYWGGLEQPAQEPVAWIDHMDGIKTVVWKERDYPAIGTKLYTHPAQPLSDD
jgi:hypothetical protein